MFFQGNMIWKTEIEYLQKLVKELLAISDCEFENIVLSGKADELRNTIRGKTTRVKLSRNGRSLLCSYKRDWRGV